MSPDKCLYRHVKVGGTSDHCEDFQRGSCPRGVSCTLIHQFKLRTGNKRVMASALELSKDRRNKGDVEKAVINAIDISMPRAIDTSFLEDEYWMFSKQVVLPDINDAREGKHDNDQNEDESNSEDSDEDNDGSSDDGSEEDSDLFEEDDEVDAEFEEGLLNSPLASENEIINE